MDTLPPEINADIKFIKISLVIWAVALAVMLWDIMVHGFNVILTMAVPGAVMVVLGMLFRQLSKRALGPVISQGLLINPEQKLVTNGMYRLIRHPSYLADILFDLGLPLVLSSVYGFVAMLFVLPFIIMRINLEEQVLGRHFGQQYVQYKQRTKKLIPFIF